jgi:hypothetical protein
MLRLMVVNRLLLLLLLAVSACTMNGEKASGPTIGASATANSGAQPSGQAASSGGAEISYTLRPAVTRPQDPAAAEAIAGCLALTGVTGTDVEQSDPPTYNATVRADARTRFEDCARDIPLYRLELAGRPVSGKLTLAQMQALRDRINADVDALNAQGVELVHWGPDVSRRQVGVGVASDLAISDKVLRDRYGDDVYVTASNRASETEPKA